MSEDTEERLRQRVSQKTRTNHNCDGYVNAAGRIHSHARNSWITGRLPGFSDVQASQLVNILKVKLKILRLFLGLFGFGKTVFLKESGFL